MVGKKQLSSQPTTSVGAHPTTGYQINETSSHSNSATPNPVRAPITAPKELARNEIWGYPVVEEPAPAVSVPVQDVAASPEAVEVKPARKPRSGAGKGVPVTYTLVPIDLVALFLQQKLSPLPSLSLPREEYLRQFITIFDKFHSCRQQLTEYTSFVASRKQFLCADQAKAFESKLQQLLDAESALKARFPVAIRNARHNGDQSELHQLLNEYHKGDSSPDKIAEIDPSDIDSITMLDELVLKVDTLLGDEWKCEKKVIAEDGNSDLVESDDNELDVDGT